jgi:hypothetical protein
MKIDSAIVPSLSLAMISRLRTGLGDSRELGGFIWDAY